MFRYNTHIYLLVIQEKLKKQYLKRRSRETQKKNPGNVTFSRAYTLGRLINNNDSNKKTKNQLKTFC